MQEEQVTGRKYQQTDAPADKHNQEQQGLLHLCLHSVSVSTRYGVRTFLNEKFAFSG